MNDNEMGASEGLQAPVRSRKVKPSLQVQVRAHNLLEAMNIRVRILRLLHLPRGDLGLVK